MEKRNQEILIRRAGKEDMVWVAEMIQELADYEEMPDGPKLTVGDLQRDGYELNPPAFKCIVAEKQSNKTVVGYAIYFKTYSTWEGQSIMLEDLYVRASERRQRIGDMLFNAVAKEAQLAGYSRLDFHVLEWNVARSFYEGKGATNLTSTEKWCFYRLTGDALKRAAIQAGETVLL